MGSETDIKAGLPNFTGVQVTAVVAAGILASLVVLVQPVILAPLAAEGRLTLAEIGRTAMFESLGMAIAIAFSGAFMRPRHLKLIAASAAAVSVVANLVSAAGSHETILMARFFNGATTGMLLWVWSGLLTNIALPGRNVAIFVASQATAGLVLSWILPAFVIERWGGSGAYVIMAGFSAINVLLAAFIPAAYPQTEGHERQRIQLPSAKGWVGLLAAACNPAAILAVWVYAVPIGEQLGLTTAFVDSAISVGIAAQIAGGLAGAVGARLPAKPALYCSITACLIGLALIASGHIPAAFMAGLAILGFALMFAACFHMPYLLEVDPSRKAGMQMVTAHQLGFASGPFLASLVVHEGQVLTALIVSASFFVCSFVLIFATTARSGTQTRTAGLRA